jgi:ABC-type cobalamin/Fe3+-siderophores transport system ATPase subunit
MPAPGLVDQLTAGLIVTDTMHETLARIEESGSARLRLVVGAAGSGKSTLLALFIRLRKANTLGADIGVADDDIKAAAFLDSTSTLESVAAELSALRANSACRPRADARLETCAKRTQDVAVKAIGP